MRFSAPETYLQHDFEAAGKIREHLSRIDQAGARELDIMINNLKTIARYRIPMRPSRITLEEWGN